MKISVYCERKDRVTVLEVPSGECARWEENDYHRRLAAAGGKLSVERRTAQQIMDEDFNKPSFNRHQTETRRHVLLSALDPEERYFSDEHELQSELLLKEEYAELHRALKELTPSQRELLRRVYWEGAKQAEIAREQKVSEAAVARRMKRIYSALKKLLTP
ncbi:MAG: sigma-70 family RNA polymerase sigma factor [Butyrivibrio sp.]|nr:sigma-70 family RNA polymerase sigma factor [Butyrivibrio sp.]